LSRRLARDYNVDILLQPAAFSRDISFRTWRSFRETRAVENSVYFVAVNYAGENYGESSFVPPWVDENHEPIMAGKEEQCLVETIQSDALEWARENMPFHRVLKTMQK
jgi:nitrilase